MTHRNSRWRQSIAILMAACLLSATQALAQSAAPANAVRPGRSVASDAVDARALDLAGGEMRALIERYANDRGSLVRFYNIATSPERRARLKKFDTDWLAALEKLDFDAMDQEARADYLLFKSQLTYELREIEIQAKQAEEMAPLVPFSDAIIALEETRQRMEPAKSQEAAATLTRMVKQIADTRRAIEAGLPQEGRAKPESKIEPIRAKKTVANRAALTIESLRNTLKAWYTFYNGYDPVFTWWASDPYKQVDQALHTYAQFLRERVVGFKADDKTAIVGDPIGREALLNELQHEMIPYTPEELVAIAKKEMAWCEAEMIKASRELGYGDDWHKALEHVKQQFVEPGKQPQLIRGLAEEAIAFVEQNDLVTVPPLARESWRMEMMTPERQLMSPFFLGGEVIQVSYPTDTMTHEQKMMSMRGNNVHFARATVFHELIPGHHLQAFMSNRYRPYRNLFRTAFWTEGNAFYWEMIFWDLGFPKTPENRIGMLFWRMHRSARVIFSLGFHLGQMAPEECVKYLIERVGHEPDNAAAEVRRSFDGSYGPVYQCAYLMGALQFRALHKELVESGKMTNRQFHDAILRENRIPVEMLRAILSGQKLTRDFASSWKYYGLP